jgi:hypothetical protein
MEVALVQASFGGTYADRDKALFLLGVKSGFRISELLSLCVEDVSQHGFPEENAKFCTVGHPNRGR